MDIGKYHWKAQSNPFGGEVDSLLGGGYEFNLGPWRLGANTSIQYTYLGIPGFDESGAGNLNARVGNQQPNSFVYTLGGNISYLWQPTWNCSIIPTLGLSWQHEFLDYGEKIEGRFANGRGAPFSFYTTTAARNNAFGNAGITVQLKCKLGAYAYYNPQFGGGQIVSHGVLLGLNYNF
jgi:outer membrane autotransporter protein